jgi:hypothetical protein
MSKLYKSTYDGPISFSGGNIVLSQGQEFDEGSDIVVERPDLFEDAGVKLQVSEKVSPTGETVSVGGESVESGEVKVAEDKETGEPQPLTTDSVPSRATKSSGVTSTSTSKDSSK